MKRKGKRKRMEGKVACEGKGKEKVGNEKEKKNKNHVKGEKE